MSRVTPDILGLNNQTPKFYRLRPPSNEAPQLRHFRCLGSLATAQSPLPYRPRLLRTSSLYLCLHDRLKGHLRRHLFEQIVEHSRAGDVPAEGDKPDGAGNVPVLGLGVERRAIHPEGVRGHGQEGLRWPRTIPDIRPPDNIQIGRHLDQPLPRHRSKHKYESYPILRPPPGVTAEIHTPAPFHTQQPSKRVHLAAHHTGHARTVLFRRHVACLIRLSPDAHGYDRRQRQDRLARYVSGLVDSEPGGPGFRNNETENVRIRPAVNVVVASSHSLFFFPPLVIICLIFLWTIYYRTRRLSMTGD